MNKTYTAHITGNKRGINLTISKLLFIDIIVDGKEWRNHCWVNESKVLNKFAPKGHKKPVKVQFTADTMDYMRGGIEEAQTLTNIRNMKLIK